MSKLLSKIKARLEPGQQFNTFCAKEPGWVRAALTSMEEESNGNPDTITQCPTWTELGERMKALGIGSGDRFTKLASRSSSKEALSSQVASQQLWETGSLDTKIPDGFYSLIPSDNLKQQFPGIPSLEQINELDQSTDPILVDVQEDRNLAKLTHIIVELVSMDANPVDAIRKIAELVMDFYGGPIFEAGFTKETNLDYLGFPKVKLLGQIRKGSCRPRAILFKYLGDAVDLNSCLLMGLKLDKVPSTSLICSNPSKHLSVVVNLNGTTFLVDLMRHPGHLRPFTVKALVAYHISGPGDSDSADYDSCDSPLEPNSPLNGSSDRLDSDSTSQSERDLANHFFRHSRRKSMSDDRGSTSSPEYPILRTRAPSMLGGSRRTVEEDCERANLSSPEHSPQYVVAMGKPSPFFRRRTSSCGRGGNMERVNHLQSSDIRRRKRSGTPEIGDDVVRVIRAMNEAVKQGRRVEKVDLQDCANLEAKNFGSKVKLQLRKCNSELESILATGREQYGAEIEENISHSRSMEGLCQDGTGVSVAARTSTILMPQANMLAEEFIPNYPLMPFPEWNIDFSELRIGIRVGIGSFGEVFRGIWKGTEVAIKVMLEQDLTKENTEDFCNEIALLSRLRHPNVILFMGACTKPPHLSMVTEYMHMGSLYRIIHISGQGQKLSWRRRLKMLRDICRGMMCVQRMGIIHRDLKSANCLVDKHWSVKICDFGLSRLVSSSTIQEPTAAGTPEWMAPELLRNEPVTDKCDVFSLGVIMWELSTLRKPWDGYEPLQVACEVAQNKTRLRAPEGLIGKLIEDCWNEDPVARPSYDQILARLHECELLQG